MSIFPALARPSVWKPEVQWNCWIDANYTWYATKCPKSKPVKALPDAPNPSRPQNRLPKANVTVQPTNHSDCQ